MFDALHELIWRPPHLTRSILGFTTRLMAELDDSPRMMSGRAQGYCFLAGGRDLPFRHPEDLFAFRETHSRHYRLPCHDENGDR